MRRPSADTVAGNGHPLSWAPSAHTVAGNGAPLNWPPSADAVAGRGGEEGKSICSESDVYHRKSEAPQLKPVPNAASRHRSPRLMRPSWRDSCRRMGTEAAEVLPYLW